MTLPEQITLFLCAQVLGVLGGVYSCVRHQAYVPPGAVRVAALGGFLSSVAVTSGVLHVYSWDRPWLILLAAVSAGVGAPWILAALVRKLRNRIEERNGEPPKS